MTLTLLYGLACAIAFAIGNAVALRRPVAPATRSALQHLAAGFVFAAVGVEVLPDVMHRGMVFPAAIGFALGIVTLLGLRVYDARGGAGGAGPGTFVAVVIIDVCIDGMLLGVSLAVGHDGGQQARLILVALVAELFTLGMTVAATLQAHDTGGWRLRRRLGVVAASPVVGALGGHWLGSTLRGGWSEGVLAFAAAALLYLAAEELLREAHEGPESLVSTALFLAAFLALLLTDMATR